MMTEYLEDLVINHNWKLNRNDMTAKMRKNQYSTSVGKTVHFTKPGKPLLPTAVMKKDSRIYDECKRLFPDFPFEMVIINKNFLSPPHKDINNTTESLIIGFGDYIGGDLAIEVDGVVEYHCVLNSPLFFNGREHTHWVEPFEGDRYTIIMGNRK